jgi:hypothetical protein
VESSLTVALLSMMKELSNHGLWLSSIMLRMPKTLIMNVSKQDSIAALSTIFNRPKPLLMQVINYFLTLKLLEGPSVGVDGNNEFEQKDIDSFFDYFN